MDKAFDVLLGQGLVGALLVLSILANGFLYREVRAVERSHDGERDAWAKALQDINDKRIGESRESVRSIDENTSVMRMIVESTNARAMAFQEMVTGQLKLLSEAQGAKDQRDRYERQLESLVSKIDSFRREKA